MPSKLIMPGDWNLEVEGSVVFMLVDTMLKGCVFSHGLPGLWATVRMDAQSLSSCVLFKSFVRCPM